MDLRQRDKFERLRREAMPRPAAAGQGAWRRICPPDVIVVGCFGLMAWLALFTWTGVGDRASRSCAAAGPSATCLALPHGGRVS